jgi:hypothetical protein
MMHVADVIKLVFLLRSSAHIVIVILSLKRHIRAPVILSLWEDHIPPLKLMQILERTRN